MSPCGLRANRKRVARVEMHDGATTGPNGMNSHGRDTHRATSYDSLARFWNDARTECDIGRGATHIECNKLTMPRLACYVIRTDNTASRATQDRAYRLLRRRGGGYTPT